MKTSSSSFGDLVSPIRQTALKTRTPRSVLKKGTPRRNQTLTTSMLNDSQATPVKETELQIPQTCSKQQPEITNNPSPKKMQTDLCQQLESSLTKFFTEYISFISMTQNGISEEQHAIELVKRVKWASGLHFSGILGHFSDEDFSETEEQEFIVSRKHQVLHSLVQLDPFLCASLTINR